MSKRVVVGAVLVVVTIGSGSLLWSPGCTRPPVDDPPATLGRRDDVHRLLANHRGKLLLLLLGREDCPGTAQATAVLDDYYPQRPADVSVLRLDVPLPDEDLKVGPWDRPYPRQLDEDRRIADRLGFIFYPTLYVYDRDGALRFQGSCDAAKIRTMVTEVLAESSGSPKKSYTLALVPEGAPGPAFTGQDIQARSVTLDALRGESGTLLVFARTSCPFTVQALPGLKAVADDYTPRGVAVAVINDGEAQEALRTVYGKHAPGVPVVWDRDGAISKAYGVDVTPFFYLLDAEGEVAQRRSYSRGAAENGLGALLGLAPARERYRSPGAG